MAQAKVPTSSYDRGGRERSWSELSEDLRELTQELRHLRGDIAQTYVRRDVYDAHHESLQSTVASTRALAMWAIGLVCGLTIASLVTFISQIGGG